MSTVKLATTDYDIRRCFAVMRQLRPHLHDDADFLVRARRQMGHDRWQLIYMEDENAAPAAVSGFRILECLSSGKTLYVDDLVTAEDQRGKRFGEALMAWMESHAREQGCETFSLDSGTQRTGAHKFYFRLGLPITAFHFSKKL